MQISTSEDKPQSFVIRLWQASPHEWRGTIHHVQSGMQRSFTKIEQTMSFIEQRAHVVTPPRAPSPTFDLSWLRRRQVRVAGAMIGMLAFALMALVLTNSSTTVPLSGAALGAANNFDLLATFLVGVGVGGLIVGVWFRFIRR